MSGRPPDPFAFLIERPFAHRGLHGSSISENGMAAFRAAVAQGHGIECDVLLSHDGVAMVFHDMALPRMTGVEGDICNWPADRLDQLPLHDGGPVPRLSDLLDLCGARVPLLIEIKVTGRLVAPICRAVAQDLARHPDAKAGVMSFNPMAMRWFARHVPGIARGLVVTEQGKQGWRAKIQRGLALWLARPDFVACDIHDLPSSLSIRMRRKGMAVLTWTVRSPDDRDRAARHADQIIFEVAGD